VVLRVVGGDRQGGAKASSLRRRASYGAGHGQLAENDQQHGGPEEKTDRSMDKVGKLGKHGDDSKGWSAAATLKRWALMKRIGPVTQVFGTVLRLSIAFSRTPLQEGYSLSVRWLVVGCAAGVGHNIALQLDASLMAAA
jgi:hypothetical protein